MKKGIVTFAGHGEQLYLEFNSITSKELKKRLENEILKLFEEYDYITFYLGMTGSFDTLVYDTLIKLKIHNDLTCEIVHVLAYLNRKNNDPFQVPAKTVYPPLETVPPQYAISRRNRWMVEQADVLIAFVWLRFGGAGRTLQYAEQRQHNHGKPKVINLAN